MIDPLYREVRDDLRQRYRGRGALCAWPGASGYRRTRKTRKEYQRILFRRYFPQLLAQWVATPDEHRKIIRG